MRLAVLMSEPHYLPSQGLGCEAVLHTRLRLFDAVSHKTDWRWAEMTASGVKGNQRPVIVVSVYRMTLLNACFRIAVDDDSLRSVQSLRYAVHLRCLPRDSRFVRTVLFGFGWLICRRMSRTHSYLRSSAEGGG